jgi:hypothetical protein
VPNNKQYQVKEAEYRYSNSSWDAVLQNHSRPDPAFVLNRPNIKEHPKATKAK